MTYGEEQIRSLDWREHMRLRPGMYIGKLGDGSEEDDGIYILLKEIIDNAVDEFIMGFGKKIEIRLLNGEVFVKDEGRGIPLGKVIDCVSQMNTGAKYGGTAFKKTVGLNGVGLKAVNALSSKFQVLSIREGKKFEANFSKGILTNSHQSPSSGHGLSILFSPDEEIFPNFSYHEPFVSEMLWRYAYLNPGLNLVFNGISHVSQKGLLDLLEKHLEEREICYPIIAFKREDFEVAFTHGWGNEDVLSFVNGQRTTMGGTHQVALREAFIKTLRELLKKDYDGTDIRNGWIVSVNIRIDEPIFESQTKTKLSSSRICSDGPTLKTWMMDIFSKDLVAFFQKNPDILERLQKKIQSSEKERKELSGIKKLVQEKTKKAAVYNKKLRDCKIHLNSKHSRRKESTIFITEGASAAGSLTKSRDVQTQAIFSLRGKPLNCLGLSKKIVYENEEFNLLQHALNIEKSLEGLRYQNIVIATDADVDGMHIRLLILTFFLVFFQDLVRNHHVYILETPLFRIRNKKKTLYVYNESEKQQAIKKIGSSPEITRFKGLGEISPEEFGQFIGKNMKLRPVDFSGKNSCIQETLDYYMGKNTPQRQNFIIENLRMDKGFKKHE